MLRYIRKQLKRSVISNVLFCLLLALAGALLCLSAGLWYSAHKALLDIDETITTIAIPNPFAVRLRVDTYIAGYEAEHGEGAVDPDYSLWSTVMRSDIYGNTTIETIESWNTEAIEQKILQEIRDTVYPSGVLQMDERRVFNAFSDGVEPVPLRATGVGLAPQIVARSPQSTAAFIVECLKIDDHHTFVSWNPDEAPYLQRHSSAVFTYEEVLHLHSSHKTTRYLTIDFFRNPDGSAPFERGKQYVVIGKFSAAGGGFSGGATDHLIVEIPDVNIIRKEVDMVYTEAEANTLLTYFWGVTISEEDLPMPVKEWVFEYQPGSGDGDYSIIELEGNMEEAFASERWARIDEALKIAEISSNSFQIITTNNPNSLYRINQRRNPFAEGRGFSAGEIRDGAKVCLVSVQFAEHNGLSAGDRLPLEIYNTVLGMDMAYYLTAESGLYVSRPLWIPSLYSSDLEVTGPAGHTIVGIYHTLTTDTSEYALSPSMVIIPDNSIGELKGEPASRFDTSRRPLLLSDAVIVPNGKIQETIERIDGVAEGYGGLFRFYDQGYESLMRALLNLRFGLAWILVLAAAGWLVVMFLFLMFYVVRKKRETVVLHAIGVSRRKRFGWIFAQCAVLIFLAAGISLAVALPLYGDILTTTGKYAESFTASFRDLTLSDAADSGVRQAMPLVASPRSLIVTAAGATALLLIGAGRMSARASVFNSLDARRGDG
jgi:hypothetical protein